jgi:hypothetical protein
MRTLGQRLVVATLLAIAAAGMLACQPDVEALRAKAEQGDAEAQLNLGNGYYHGEGVPQDYAEAAKWNRLAAEQGHASAQYHLGFMYDNGQGVPQDYAEAVKWYRLAAEQGHAEGLRTSVQSTFHATSRFDLPCRSPGSLQNTGEEAMNSDEQPQ